MLKGRGGLATADGVNPTFNESEGKGKLSRLRNLQVSDLKKSYGRRKGCSTDPQTAHTHKPPPHTRNYTPQQHTPPSPSCHPATVTRARPPPPPPPPLYTATLAHSPTQLPITVFLLTCPHPSGYTPRTYNPHPSPGDAHARAVQTHLPFSVVHTACPQRVYEFRSSKPSFLLSPPHPSGDQHQSPPPTHTQTPPPTPQTQNKHTCHSLSSC